MLTSPELTHQIQACCGSRLSIYAFEHWFRHYSADVHTSDDAELNEFVDRVRKVFARYYNFAQVDDNVIRRALAECVLK